MWRTETLLALPTLNIPRVHSTHTHTHTHSWAPSYRRSQLYNGNYNFGNALCGRPERERASNNRTRVFPQ